MWEDLGGRTDDSGAWTPKREEVLLIFYALSCLKKIEVRTGTTKLKLVWQQREDEVFVRER